MKKLLLLCFVIFATSLIAQDWNITGAGARAAGFGGAFIGIADDATAIGWNPGGLTQLYRPEVSLVTRFIDQDFHEDIEYMDYSQNHFALNFGSVAYPFMDGKLVTAFAYQQQLDMYSDWFDDESDKGGAFTLSPGVAYQVIPLISVGFSANIWTGAWESKNITETSDINFSGFNLNLGTMLNLRNLNNPLPMQFGFSLRTPFELNVDVDNNVQGSWTNKVEMPLMMGFGASYFLGENLIFSADYEMRFYGKSSIIRASGDIDNLSASEKDLMQFRIGAEYMLVTDFAAIPLRAGFKTVPTLLATGDYNYNASGNYYSFEPDQQVVGNGFALGSGLIFGRFAIDLTYDSEAYDHDYTVDGSDYTDKHTKANLGISGTFYF